MNLGVMELLVLMFASPGQASDLVGLIDVQDYFKSRNLPMTIEKKIEFAGSDPKTADAQLRQLLSLRWFGDNADTVKKSNEIKAIRKLLKKIAGGKFANDRLGFAKEYASAVLARLEGKAPPPFHAEKNAIRKEALSWFPSSANLIGAIEFGGGSIFSSGDKVNNNPLFAQMPDEFRKKMLKQFYDTADEVGNLRLGRISFAYTEDLQNQQQSQIFVRIRGKVDHQRVLDWIKRKAPGQAQMQTRKGLKGKTITTMQFGGQPPVIAMIGDRDMVFVGMQGNAGNHQQVLNELLSVRAGRLGSVATGPMQKQLNAMSENATGLLIGKVPMTMRRMFGQGVPMPYYVTMQLKSKGKFQELSFDGKMANNIQAMNFKKLVLKGRDDAVQKMQNPPPGMPANLFVDLRKMLKSLKIDAKGDSVTGSMLVDPKVLMSFPMMGMNAMRAGIRMPLVFVMRASR